MDEAGSPTTFFLVMQQDLAIIGAHLGYDRYREKSEAML